MGCPFLNIFRRRVGAHLSVTSARQTAFKLDPGVSARIVQLHECVELHRIVDAAGATETGPVRVGILGLPVGVTSACGLVGSKLIGGGTVALPGRARGYAARQHHQGDSHDPCEWRFSSHEAMVTVRPVVSKPRVRVMPMMRSLTCAHGAGQDVLGFHGRQPDR